MAQFPTTPEVNDPHQEGDVIWIYDGEKWVKQTPIIKTENVTLSDPTHPAQILPEGQAIPDVPAGTETQLDVNRWFANSLVALDTKFEDGDIVAGIHVGENPPDEVVNGTLWFDSSADTLSLFLYYHPDPDQPTGVWVPAAPPVSAIEEINSLLGDLTADVEELEIRALSLNSIGTSPPSPVQDSFIWRDTTAGKEKAYIYDQIGGQGWISLSPAVTVMNDAPEDPATGDLWYDEDDVVLFVYSNNSWIPVSITPEIINRVELIEEQSEDNADAIEQLQLDVEELKLTKGALAQYELDEIASTLQARPGKFNVDDAQSTNVTAFSFGAEDIAGNLTQPVQIGDILEIANSNNPLDFGRYVTTSDNMNLLGVTFVSGSGVFVVGETYNIYVFPMNQDSASQDYVDNAVATKVSKSGDTITGKLVLSADGQANDDGVRLYLKDNTGTTNITLFPSGLIQTSNVVRVNKDTGDAYQVKDSTGNTVRMKITSAGHVEAPKLKLTGGNAANRNERTLDVQTGYAGHLAYNNQTKLSWGYSYVGIGPSSTLGDPDISNFKLILYGHEIDQVGKFNLKHEGTSERKFVIKGETSSGDESVDFFYSYRNPSGQLDAMNYNGKMTSDSNLVNKKYVDDKVATVDTSGNFLPLGGGTMTGLLSFNRPGNNQQVSFLKSGNNDIWYNGKWIVSFQGNDSPKVKLASTLDMGNQYIANVKDPASDTDGVNRRSLKGANVTATSSGNATTGGFYMSDGRLFYKS